MDGQHVKLPGPHAPDAERQVAAAVKIAVDGERTEGARITRAQDGPTAEGHRGVDGPSPAQAATLDVDDAGLQGAVVDRLAGSLGIAD